MFVPFRPFVDLICSIEVVIVGYGVKSVLNASVKFALVLLVLQHLVCLLPNLQQRQLILIPS